MVVRTRENSEGAGKLELNDSDKENEVDTGLTFNTTFNKPLGLVSFTSAKTAGRACRRKRREPRDDDLKWLGKPISVLRLLSQVGYTFIYTVFAYYLVTLYLAVSPPGWCYCSS